MDVIGKATFPQLNDLKKGKRAHAIVYIIGSISQKTTPNAISSVSLP
jgi:hypothetical protein